MDALWPSDVAVLYGLGGNLSAEGQTIGILAGGGGFKPTDLEAAMKAMGRPAPLVTSVSVDGVDNLFGNDTKADAELALDLQVAAALAPHARLVVYFAPATQAGIAGAIQRAVEDAVNRPDVLSISWGSPELYWTLPWPKGGTTLDAVEAALKAARDRDLTVVAAIGDDLATAREDDGQAHVLYPGSSPLVLSCGGTRVTLDAKGGSITDETVWNEIYQGTGGGVSDLFAVPSWQQDLALPPSLKDGQSRRSVPDVAAAAATDPGYRIVLDGIETTQEGTSAATPFWAGLIALANCLRGRPLGFVNPRLYAQSLLFRAILEGDNRVDGLGFNAGLGWNACCGLGAPSAGAALVAALAAAA